ncbi:37410_t:CDS:2, partial [Gigaspora margarita]
MVNASSVEDNEFIKRLQDNDIDLIEYSEFKDAKLVKIRGYGIVLKGSLRETSTIIKHLPNELTDQEDNNNALQLNTKSILINNEKVQISNPVFLELNLDSSSSISLQEGMIGFIDPELLKDLNLQFTKLSDIYSLGMVMWSITSERLPFENYTIQSALIMPRNIREKPIQGTPQEYIKLYERCWSRNSKERPTAQEV